LNEELIEARAVIKAMRATLEDKATDEFLSPKTAGTESSSGTEDKQAPSIAAQMDDPLGAAAATITPDQDEDSVVGTKKREVKTKQADDGPVAESIPEQPTKNHSAEITALESKVKELTAALAEKNAQYLELEGSLAQRTSELAKQKSDQDEKMKKMKAIFAAANKNLNEYRQSIAAKDEEISELKACLEMKGPSEEQAIEQSRRSTPTCFHV
jgi:chromosome segregation ATPase